MASLTFWYEALSKLPCADDISSVIEPFSRTKNTARQIGQVLLFTFGQDDVNQPRRHDLPFCGSPRREDELYPSRRWRGVFWFLTTLPTRATWLEPLQLPFSLGGS